MVSDDWFLGSEVVISCTVTNRAGQSHDATLTCTVRAPDGTTTHPTMTHLGAGRYESDGVLLDQPREWRYRVKAAGALVGAFEGRIHVKEPIL